MPEVQNAGSAECRKNAGSAKRRKNAAQRVREDGEEKSDKREGCREKRLEILNLEARMLGYRVIKY